MATNRPQPRVASKTTDKLVMVLDQIEHLTKRKNVKSVLVTWDRIEDPEEGTTVVPILDIRFKD